MDPIAASAGSFTARVTADGGPTGFEVAYTSMAVVRGASRQEIPTGDGLGAVALCHLDGRVLGYGTLTIEDFGWYASQVDGRPADDGPPMERLAAVGLALVLPLDAMPAEVRDAFLGEMIDADLVDAARMTDRALAEANAEHGAHDHDHTDHCDTCAVRSVHAQIDDLVATVGHAVIVTPDSPGEVSYTVGLADAGWPELAMSGIPSRSIEILNAVVSRLRGGELRPVAGMTVDKAMSVDLRLRAVDSTRIGGAARIRAEARGAAQPAFLQVTWPDADGYHPDEREYDDIHLPQALL